MAKKEKRDRPGGTWWGRRTAPSRSTGQNPKRTIGNKGSVKRRKGASSPMRTDTPPWEQYFRKKIDEDEMTKREGRTGKKARRQRDGESQSSTPIQLHLRS